MTSKPRFDDLKLGCLLILTETVDASPLPLELTTVTGQISGPVASVTVAQRFGNPFKERVNLEYLFPLPHEAAIFDYEIRIGTRTIRADLKEAAAARKTFEEAMADGKRSSLLEQRRPNLFAIQIANVQPGETIFTTLRYQERVAYDDGFYTFVFPMGITPRYHTPSMSPADADKLTAPVIEPGSTERVAPVELSLSVDAGAVANDPVSPSHTLNLTRLDEGRFNVSLAGANIANKDFTLRYAVSNDAVRAATWTSRDDDAETALITLLPPRLDTTKMKIPPREFVFVLDRSGSMSGGPITQAKNALKACLRALGDQDTFTIQAFDDKLEWFSKDAQAVTQEHVNAADAWLANVDGRNGTEIVPAIEAALKLKVDPNRLRYVVFLTDGAVSAEEKAYKQISQGRGDARIFTFGIGPSVNRALLARIAALGRGTAEFLRVTDDIETAITRFQDRVSYPALLDIKLEYRVAETWDSYPGDLPDLYVGQPLEIVTRLKRSKPGPVRLTVTGKRGDEKVKMEVTIPVPTAHDPALRRLWARKRIETLHDSLAHGGDEEKIRQATIALSLETRLVTSYTAFVAVDSEVADTSEKARSIQISVPLPDGLDYTGFFGEPPGSNVPHAARAAFGGMPPAPTGAHFLKRLAAPAPKMMMAREELDDLVAAVPPPSPAAMPAPMAELAIAPAQPGNPFGFNVEGAKEAGKRSLDILKSLARSQKLDGSWDIVKPPYRAESVAAALLAFIRAGFTARSGSYRRQVGKAADWLVANWAQLGGFARFAAFRALMELDTKDGTNHITPEMRQSVVSPGSHPEQAAVNPGGVSAPTDANSLDDLRIAALVSGAENLPKLPSLGDAWELGVIWWAVGPGR